MNISSYPDHSHKWMNGGRTSVSPGGRIVNPSYHARTWEKVFLLAVLIFSFANRYTIDIGGLNLKPEYAFAGLAVVFLAFTGRVRNVLLVEGGVFLLGWLAINLVSSLAYAPEVLVSLKNLGLLVCGVLTLVFVVYMGDKLGLQVVETYLDLGFIAILVSLVGGMFDILSGTNFFLEPKSFAGYLRIIGIFREPNYFGICSMILGIILWDRFFNYSVGRKSRLDYLLRTLICFGGVLQSGTRSAQILCLIGIIVVVIISKTQTVGRLLKIVSFTSVLLIISILVFDGIVETPYTAYILSTIEGDPSAQAGILFRQTFEDGPALSQIPDALWLGHGTETFGQVNSALDWMGNNIMGEGAGTFYLNNFALKLLYDTGIIGTIVALLWLATYHIATLKWSRVAGASPYLWPFALTSVLMFASFMTSNGILLSFPWVHMGMTTILLRSARRSNALNGRQREQFAGSETR